MCFIYNGANEVVGIVFLVLVREWLWGAISEERT